MIFTHLFTKTNFLSGIFKKIGLFFHKKKMNFRHFNNYFREADILEFEIQNSQSQKIFRKKKKIS